MSEDGPVRFGSYSFELSNQDKVLFPEAGITKGDLCDYYRDVAELMLPHLRGRPLSLQRFPDGIDEEGFYQKQVSEHFPSWIHTVTVPKREEGGSNEQVVADNAATVVYLANQGTITLHVWPSRTADLERPDRIVFDLDPPGDEFEIVVDAARDIHAALDEIDLVGYPMTTGSRGLHVSVPIRPEETFESVSDFAAGVARLVAARHPDRYTTAFRKAKRRGRLFLDTRRNEYAQTSVAPYSVRPRAGAPVATPLDWSEIDSSDVGPRNWTLRNLGDRLADHDDPWAGIERHRRALERPRETLGRLLEESAGETP